MMKLIILIAYYYCILVNCTFIFEENVDDDWELLNLSSSLILISSESFEIVTFVHIANLLLLGSVAVTHHVSVELALISSLILPGGTSHPGPDPLRKNQDQNPKIAF